MKKHLTFDNITQTDSGGYQVRIVRQGKETSRYFSFRQLGNERKAFEAANNWRDQILVVFGGHPCRKRWLKPSITNKSTGVLGVSRTTSYDHRKDLRYLVFNVGWIDYQGEKRTKTFRVCNVKSYDKTMESKAFAAAKAFRLDWEHHCDNNTLHIFDPKDYLNWRTMQYIRT